MQATWKNLICMQWACFCVRDLCVYEFHLVVYDYDICHKGTRIPILIRRFTVAYPWWDIAFLPPIAFLSREPRQSGRQAPFPTQLALRMNHQPGSVIELCCLPLGLLKLGSVSPFRYCIVERCVQSQSQGNEPIPVKQQYNYSKRESKKSSKRGRCSHS